MSLPTTQRAFIGQVLSEEEPPPAEWDNPRMKAGLAIYRNGYRSRLIDALADTFPRTKQWVGEDSFDQAAAHHLIANPPGHWSLDLAGSGFPETLSELFGNDPEVPELAALEWDMHVAFVSDDAKALNGLAFAATTSRFSDADWSRLRLEFHPSVSLRIIRTNAAAVWRSLADESDAPSDLLLHDERYLIVWREGTRPAFRTVEPREARMITALMRHQTFDEACAGLSEKEYGVEDAAAIAGEFLGRWLQDAMVVGVDVSEGYACSAADHR